AERQRQAEEQRRQEEAERQRQAEEQRRQEEAERQRQAEEQRRQEEAERQRQAEEQRRREEAARRAAEAAAGGLDGLIASEQEAIANARQATEASNSFQNLVRRAVEQAWIIPPGSVNGLEATLQLNLLPTGELVGVSVLRGSGDTGFDRSALQAVERAAPFREMRQLPPAAQNQFRQFNLRFRPGDIR
ncbi:cell envelope integrity protein TolA, partial [Halomonas sp. 328]|uniref:cell envelope integrity protein TolA n=1 Tax=Halomonas sp. 328 TaxID=2776704 RepID=UPI0018A7D702